MQAFLTFSHKRLSDLNAMYAEYNMAFIIILHALHFFNYVIINAIYRSGLIRFYLAMIMVK